MSDQSGFFTRLGNWFKGGRFSDGSALSSGNSTLHADEFHDENGNGGGEVLTSTALATPVETRSTFLRPWAKRDAALHNLQEGFVTLTGLMSSVKESLDQQNRRQDEMINILSQLPAALQSIPESNRVQTETLKAMADQIRQQAVQGEQLGEILDKMNVAEEQQRKVMEDLRGGVGKLSEHDEKIADSLNEVGTAMSHVSEHSKTSADALIQMRDDVNAREGELQRLLQRQGSRYTTMLAIAIFLSVGALTAVCVIGYMMMLKMH